MANKYFYPETEYNRYAFGKFKDGFAEKMLKEYGEIAVDSPKLTEVNKVGAWSVIPVPSDVSIESFMDLVGWLTQDEEFAYGIAVHKTNSYYVVRDLSDRRGETVVVGFDDGEAGEWNLPYGFMKQYAAYRSMGRDCINKDTVYENCKELLKANGAEALIEYFGL